ncbi:MAG: TonB-dependent receptor [Gemmatimonadetes bacterium]|nr:TonB-dependent receptor [Gemmatimonadota bacterium]MYB68833.1 TonB-dependent receptor [Gemmatimonadota bacterium]
MGGGIMKFIRTIAVIFAVQLAQDAHGQIAVSGTVVSDETGDALPGATVVIEGTYIGTMTDQDGAYSIDLRSPEDILIFSFVGFQTKRLTISLGVTTLDVRLEPSVVGLEGISVVAEQPRIFASNVVAEPMILQQSNITSVTAVVDNLPGVSIQEGDAYGFDDWSSNVAMRGFQVTLTEVQIGTTIDEFPNGTSDYWGGSKANRFIDPMNLGGVEVSQGTADIASRSIEALGGTFDYLTDNPATERTYTASITMGENEGQRFAMRVDTGPLFGRDTRAWIAAVRQEVTDWVEGSARNEREHVAAKLVSSHGRLDLTSYFSYDSIHEDVYQRLYSDADFRANPRWDRLVGEWPGVPYLNQFYRPGWQTRRNNTLAYLKADWSFSDVISLSLGGYFHRNRGRGDWLPPFIADVTDDGGGPESELMGGTPVLGGSQLGLIRFVSPDGVGVGPAPGCTSSYIFNYYGSGGPEVDPACHPGTTAVQSYRHSHYGKDRVGVTLDEEWFAAIGAAGSTLRAGIWYENTRRDLGRDWHQILDPTLSFNWNEQPYWQQYDWQFPQQVFKWYAEETIFAGPVALSGGIKQYLVSVSREDLFGIDPDLEVDSDSELLFSGGVTYETPIDGLDLFAGYSENFKAISSTLLEVPDRSLDLLEPETASNIDVGLQYAGNRVALSGTWYAIDFQNRIFYLGPQTPTGPNYLIPGGGAYFNAGGLQTKGLEFSATVRMPQQMSFYTAATLNDSEYIGSGDPLVDASQNIVAGSDVTGVPDKLWVVSLDRTGPIRTGLTAKYTSSRRVSLTADWYTDAYWLVDAYVSFSGTALDPLLRSTEFSLVANNLLDRAYLSAITENAAWLGAPRTVSMTATVSF